MPISLAMQNLWVAAVGLLLVPSVRMLRLLGSYALGAFLWRTPTFLVSMHGISLLGTPFLPSMRKIADAISGFHAGNNFGMTFSYILLLYVVLYFNCLVAGYCFP